MFNHKGITITVAANGKFKAAVDEIEIEFNTLEGVKERIDRVLAAAPKRTIALPVVAIVDTIQGGAIAYLSITGIHRNTSELIFGGPYPGRINIMCPDTPDNRRIMEKHLAGMLAMEASLREISKIRIEPRVGYGRMDIDAYEGKLSKLEEEYQQKARPSEKTA